MVIQPDDSIKQSNNTDRSLYFVKSRFQSYKNYSTWSLLFFQIMEMTPFILSWNVSPSFHSPSSLSRAIVLVSKGQRQWFSKLCSLQFGNYCI